MKQTATGEAILQELVKNLDQSLEPLLYTVLAPSVFDVYLHPDDLDRLRGIFPQLAAEAKQALDEKLELLRREAQPSRLRRLLPGQPQRVREFRSVAGDWYVSFHENTDPDVEPGDILIESKLMLPPSEELGAGSRTKRISTLRSQGTTRLVASDTVDHRPDDRAGATTERVRPAATWSALPEPAPALSPGDFAGPTTPGSRLSGTSTRVSRPTDPAPSARPMPPPATATTPTSPGLPTVDRPAADPRGAPTDRMVDPASQGRRARLRYTDDTGDHLYVMTRGEIVIGRGGTGYLVDVKLETVPDVSRAHVKIRRDDAGRFFIRDVSAFGTTLDGVRLPQSLDEQGSRKIDRNREVALPARARIGLADVVHIDFEVID